MLEEVYFEPTDVFKGRVNVSITVSSLNVEHLSVINTILPVVSDSPLRGISRSASGDKYPPTHTHSSMLCFRFVDAKLTGLCLSVSAVMITIDRPSALNIHCEKKISTGTPQSTFLSDICTPEFSGLDTKVLVELELSVSLGSLRLDSPSLTVLAANATYAR